MEFNLLTLLLGKNGQLGSAFKRRSAENPGFVALDRSGVGDLSNPALLSDYIRTTRPNVIINAAAYTAVDAAEDNPELAFQINALAPASIAQAAKDVGALLVHFSSDYVYGGSGQKPWAETDLAAPINIYGQSKLAGDQAIETSGCRYLIFRTSWVFSANGQNFLNTMLRLAGEREELRVVDDQIGAPTSVELIVSTALRAIELEQQDGSLTGIYHLAAAGETSWFDYAKFAIETAKELGLKIVAKNIIPVHSAEFVSKARRPMNSRLDTGKLCSSIGISMPSWQDDVREAIIAIRKASDEK
jgi:dTDP-4-dehydrorhamnose reductase